MKSCSDCLNGQCKHPSGCETNGYGEYETQAFGLNGTLEIDTDQIISKFSWGDPISANYTELFLNIRGIDTPLMLQFKDELLLGRKGNDETGPFILDLTPFGGDEKGVSRTHAALRRLKNTLFLVDMGSSNGTFVNGQRLVSEQPNMLIEGDEIRLGNLVATITYTPSDAGAS
jgi:hypothetical protein